MQVEKSGKRIYSWRDMVHLAKHFDGYLMISWRYRDDQKRNAARRAAKKGFLKRVKGRSGFDCWKLIDGIELPPRERVPECLKR